MIGVVADANFDGQLARLRSIFESSEWSEFWHDLALRIFTFHELGLNHDAIDRVVYDRCQQTGLVLITGNRNHNGPDSLEAVLRQAPPMALPIFTVGDAERLMVDSNYARAVASDLLDYLTTLRDTPETLLGAGRIYLPKKST